MKSPIASPPRPADQQPGEHDMKLGLVTDAAPTLDMRAGVQFHLYGLIGIGIAAVAPAAFWTAIAYWIFAAFGAPLSLGTATIIALAIFAFLTVIVRAIAASSA